MRVGRCSSAVAAATLGTLLAGCGSSSSPPIRTTPSAATKTTTVPAGAPLTSTLPNVGGSAALPSPRAASYGGGNPSVAVLVQWTQLSSQLIGRLQESQLSASGAPSAHKASFMGSLQNGQVSLSLAGGGTATGTISGRTLSLTVPMNGGGTSTVQLGPGGQVAYQSAIGMLGQTGSTTGGAITGPSGPTGPSGAQVPVSSAGPASFQIQNDAANVSSDVASLHDLVAGLATQTKQTLQSDVSQVRSDLGQVQSDYQAVVQAAEGQSDPVLVCTDSQTVGGDMQSLRGDVQIAKADAQGASANASPVRQQITTLQQDDNALVSAEGGDTAAVPSGTPSPGDVQRAIDAANAAVNVNVSQYISEAESLEQQGQNDAQQAGMDCQSSG
ncbi:MAG TPA: hypothetical protein VHX88_21955 [Solirubrobacteraceae bacterium]|nr:hypothetical protein [Solirubrobacteraceae bacterium]